MYIYCSHGLFSPLPIVKVLWFCINNIFACLLEYFMDLGKGEKAIFGAQGTLTSLIPY